MKVIEIWDLAATERGGSGPRVCDGQATGHHHCALGNKFPRPWRKPGQKKESI